MYQCNSNVNLIECHENKDRQLLTLVKIHSIVKKEKANFIII